MLPGAEMRLGRHPAIATHLAVARALGIAIWGDWLKSVASRRKLTLSISMLN